MPDMPVDDSIHRRSGTRRRLRRYSLALGLLLLLSGAAAEASSRGSLDLLDEYEIKAGFLYRILFFADWPPAAAEILCKRA